jgi:hypothetical protein
MAKKKKNVYIKGQVGVSEFIYIDLLPEVKRIRQINGQVIIVLLLFVILAFSFIFFPYRGLTTEFEEKNGLHSDLTHELALTQEEFVGFEINMTTINFEKYIEGISNYVVDYEEWLGDVILLANQYNANIEDIDFSLEGSQFDITISMSTFYRFEEMNSAMQNIPWISLSSYSTPQKVGDQILYESTYSLAVIVHAE